MNSNLGMYAETVINRTCEFYSEKQIALIEKRQIPFKIIKTMDSGTFFGKLLSKSFLDYFGVIKGKHVEFEVKQTKFEYFNTDLIKNHQWEYMEKLLEHNCFPFLIVYFEKFNKFCKIDFVWLKNIDKRIIDYSIIEKECETYDVVFPGIISFVK